MIPDQRAGFISRQEGLDSLQLTRIFDNACLALMSIFRPGVATTDNIGGISVIAG